MKTKMLSIATVLAVLTLLSGAASATNGNLILNGDFEANSAPYFPDVPTGTWQWFEASSGWLGWSIANTFPAESEFPPGLEIWDTLYGWPAASGTQYVELDGYDPTTIYGLFFTTNVGYCYELSYAWSPRPGVADNQMKVYVDYAEVAHHVASGVGNSSTVWTWEQYLFQVSVLTSTIAFAEVGPDDQLGMLLDAVSVTECPLISVVIDIKPGSDPNSINLRSQGLAPVAVLTTDNFDASSVDPATVTFAGASPIRWATEDVDYDGDLDLLFHFATQELDLDGSSIEAVLTGETFGGRAVEGADAVRMIGGEEFNVCPFEPIMIELTSSDPVKVPIQITSSGQDVNFGADDPPGVTWTLTYLSGEAVIGPEGPDDHFHLMWQPYSFSEPGFYYVVFENELAATYPVVRVNLACVYDAPEP